jgi:adenylate cyclase
MSESRKLAAILVADVVGYSRLAGTDEDRTLARLRGLRSDLIDPAIAAHHGRIVKRTGDGSIVEFRSVVDAVRCAIEVQNGLIERNIGVPRERRIEFRVGIHVGDIVEESDGDLMGDGVNIAARLQGIAQPGAICLSEDAYRQVKQRLDLKVNDLGLTPLKNIAEPIRVYSLEVGVPDKGKPTRPATLASKPRPFWRSALGVTVAIVLMGLVAGTYAWMSGLAPRLLGHPAEDKLANAPRLSIVVLPFANLSGDPAQDYLVDALTDGLTTSLARLTRLRGGFVIARNTAMTFKGKPVDAKAVGKALGVRYVLEGSVQPSGDQVRVNAQLIDADTNAHLWAEQFDTPRADLLQTQDAIVSHLLHPLDIQLIQAEGARVKRTPAANPDAEDLALQCEAAAVKGSYVVNEDYRLCEQALAIDPNNVRALVISGIKPFMQASLGVSGDPTGDMRRADELESKALAIDPDDAVAHHMKGNVLQSTGHPEEAVAEHERAFAIDPSQADAVANLGVDYLYLGQFEKSIEYADKAIRMSLYDPAVLYWYGIKAWAYFGLKRYDQAIDWARQAIAINPNYVPYVHVVLVAALALTGHDAEAREALQRYLALPSTGALKTIAAWNAFYNSKSTATRFFEINERTFDGLRKAGMPEE